jgi:CHAT domain-containing protein
LFTILVFLPQSGFAQALSNVGAARELIAAGDCPAALEILEPIATGLDAPTELRLQALMLSSDCYRAMGMTYESLDTLNEARTLATESTSPDELAALYNRIGAANRAAGLYDEAVAYLNEGIEISNDIERPDLAATLYNDLGAVHVAQVNMTYAIDAYAESLRKARAAQEPALIATAAINLSRALIDSDFDAGIRAYLKIALVETRKMPDGPARLTNLVVIGDMYRRAMNEFDLPVEMRKEAYTVLDQALMLAWQLGDDRMASYAEGYQGRLYEEERRLDEALVLTRRAAFRAQRVNAFESLYLWEWQTARLLVAKGDEDAGLEAYRRAIETLGKIRNSVSTTSRSDFNERVGGLYSEHADLLLRRAARLENRDAIRKNLLEVRDTLEKRKVAEIVDYFENECVISDEDPTNLDRLSNEAAIIYPVLLPDRTELLVSFPGELVQFTVPVGRARLTEEIRRLRVRIEKDNGRDDYRKSAQNLYQWLIAPLEQRLEDDAIDTLVIVPGGALRTIPLSVLHDGRQFLVVKYSLATTPGMSMTEADTVYRDDSRILSSGLTESVQGFPALPNVEKELNSIDQLHRTKRYQNQEFQLEPMGQEISEGDYSIVHIATHGEFDRDHRKSFLLTYDGKLTMSGLEKAIGSRRFQEDGIDLLVLSACKTAAGDDAAALGLAGVAIKAGAKSALATLWYIDDESTSELVASFYRYLKDPGKTKAEALREAQLGLIYSEDHNHPVYWAPFLLIGNWL